MSLPYPRFLPVSGRADDAHLDSDRRPTSIGRQDVVGVEHACRREDERVRQLEPAAVRRSERCGAASNLPRGGLDRGRQSVEKRVERGDGIGPATARTHERLSVRRRRQNQLVSTSTRLAERGDRGGVMDVASVERGDHHARVKDS